jgi:hypothetical protein
MLALYKAGQQKSSAVAPEHGCTHDTITRGSCLKTVRWLLQICCAKHDMFTASLYTPYAQNPTAARSDILKTKRLNPPATPLHPLVSPPQLLLLLLPPSCPSSCLSYHLLLLLLLQHQHLLLLHHHHPHQLPLLLLAC